MPLIAKVQVVTNEGIFKKGEAIIGASPDDIEGLLKSKFAVWGTESNEVSLEKEILEEEQDEVDVEEETQAGGEPAIHPSLNTFKKMKKDDLVNYALSMNMDVDLNLTKENLANAVSDFIEKGRSVE